MNNEIQLVTHFESLDLAERAREYLEDAGLDAFVYEETSGDNGYGVYALYVPDDDAEYAEELLDEMPEAESVLAMATLAGWESDSEELRNNFDRF